MNDMNSIVERLERMEAAQAKSVEEITELIKNTSNENLSGIAGLRADLESQKIHNEQTSKALDLKINSLELSINTKISSLQSQIDDELAQSREALKNFKYSQMYQAGPSCNLELLQKIDKLERDAKRKNILITGLPCNYDNVTTVSYDLLNSKFNAGIHIQEVRLIPPRKDNKTRVIVVMKSESAKHEILHMKHHLKGSNIYIDSDLTKRESEIVGRLSVHIRDLRSKKHVVKRKHLQLSVDGNWFTLNLDSNSLVPVGPSSGANLPHSVQRCVSQTAHSPNNPTPVQKNLTSPLKH